MWGSRDNENNNDFRKFILQFSKVSFCHVGNQYFD